MTPPSAADRTLRDGLLRALEYFWHPVCTVAELEASAPHPLAVQLLGRSLAVADVGVRGAPHVMAVTNRCMHRSTRLSVGWVEPPSRGESVGSLRCAYHGWRYDSGGACVEIPAVPEGPLPTQVCLERFEAEIAYGLVWVRLDGAVGTAIPANPAWDDTTLHVVPGPPYTWPTSALRRVENFVDLAHFAWVHDGSLGRRDQPVPPIPTIAREAGEMRFTYDPPTMDVAQEALFGFSRYRMPMPCTVDIEFEHAAGERRHLWMTASPLDERSSRTFWFVSRSDELGADDASHLAFQQQILDEDEPVVCNQDPPEMVLDPGLELSVRTDRVSIEYRRWLRDLAEAANTDSAAVAAVLQSAIRTSDPPRSITRST